MIPAIWNPDQLQCYRQGNYAFIAIPQPIIPAIISSNRRSVIDRKLRRKAESHKTIPCRAWHESGRCNYGNRCKFAHGEEDLRKAPTEPIKVYNNPRYRTAPCLKYQILGSCPYGDRCSYIHESYAKVDVEKCLEALSPPQSPSLSSCSSSSTESRSNTITRRITGDPFRTEQSCKANIEFQRVSAIDCILQQPLPLH